MKKIIFTILLLFSVVAIAQNTNEKYSYVPAKGNFTVSLLTGKGFYASTSSTGFYTNSNSVGLVPIQSATDLNNNDLFNMVGVEGKYFLNNRGFALTLSLGGRVTHQPQQINIPEVEVNGKVAVKGYDAVVGFDRADVYVAPGVQWTFNLKSPRLLPYIGFAVPFNYGRYSYINPEVTTSGTTVEADYGMKHAEYVGLGIHSIAGLDYYLTKSLFIGFDVKPLSYNYGYNSAKPRPGAMKREVEQISYSFFSNYMFKFGFRL